MGEMKRAKEGDNVHTERTEAGNMYTKTANRALYAVDAVKKKDEQAAFQTLMDIYMSNADAAAEMEARKAVAVTGSMMPYEARHGRSAYVPESVRAATTAYAKDQKTDAMINNPSTILDINGFLQMPGGGSSGSLANPLPPRTTTTAAGSVNLEFPQLTVQHQQPSYTNTSTTAVQQPNATQQQTQQQASQQQPVQHITNNYYMTGPNNQRGGYGGGRGGFQSNGGAIPVPQGGRGRGRRGFISGQ
jgi:hypothetical protein